MAQNEVVSGSFVAANMVPVISDVCVRQPVHW
jgi:hypothetical protein